MDHQQKQLLLNPDDDHRIYTYSSGQFKTKLKNVVFIFLLLFNLIFVVLWIFPIYSSFPLALHRDLGIVDVARYNNLQALTWTTQAAEEAEAATSYHCSGHGYVLVDTVNIVAND